MLLAVSTSDNGLKILANADGVRLLRSMENRPFDASRVSSASAVKVVGLMHLLSLFFNVENIIVQY